MPRHTRTLCRWGALVATGVFAFLLAGIENIGVMIEEPHRCVRGSCVKTSGQQRSGAGLLMHLPLPLGSMPEHAALCNPLRTGCCH